MGKRERKLKALVGKTFRQEALKKELNKALPGTLWDWYPCEGGLVIGTRFGSKDWHVTLKAGGRDALTVDSVSSDGIEEEGTTQTSGLGGKEDAAWESTRAQGLPE